MIEFLMRVWTENLATAEKTIRTMPMWSLGALLIAMPFGLVLYRWFSDAVIWLSESLPWWFWVMLSCGIFAGANL